MIKKLYSSDLKDNGDDDEVEGLLKARRPTKQDKLEVNMTKRAIFSHKYRRLAYIKYLGWCCWCKPGNKREDFLFRDAKEKLNNETDLLEMVKNMRIFKFTSDIILKPRQKDLVNFFEAYKLRETKEPEAKKPHQFSKRLQSVRTKRKYTSHGAQGQAP